MTIQKFDEDHLQALCNVLADTSKGLTGSQIQEILSQLNIPDISPASTKRYRLFQALSLKQQQDKCGNHVIAFLQKAMAPVRYVNNQDFFEARRTELNTVLAFCGYELGKDGKIRAVQKADTIDEAQKRANLLKKKLMDRKVHIDVLRFCRSELLQDNYFHAVFEATKSVADKIREKTGLVEDGAELVDKAFGVSDPFLAINTLRTPVEQSEQKGFTNLLKGLFGVFRNTTARIPKIKWIIEEQDALDLLSLVSYIHRRLDAAPSTKPNIL